MDEKKNSAGSPVSEVEKDATSVIETSGDTVSKEVETGPDVPKSREKFICKIN